MGIFDTVAVVGTVNAKVKTSAVEGNSCDGRQNFTYRVPHIVAPKVAVAADVYVRDMRARVHELTHSVSPFNAQLDSGWSVESALKRMTAAWPAEEKRAVVLAAEFIVRVYIEDLRELRNVSEDGVKECAADISRNIRPMNHSS